MNLFEKIGLALFKSISEEDSVDYDDNVLKEISDLAEKQDTNIRFFKDKETGNLRWVTAWTSNYEDDDYPSDIISEKAHKSFIERVEKGELPYPDLWHWHTEGTKWGVSDFLAYDDDYGINWASGIIEKGHEREALALMKSGIEIGVSHGMKGIERDPHDNKVITQYITYEISDLPLRWAANKMTAMFIAENNSTEDDMTLKNEKKDYLRKVGLSDEDINELDKFGKEQADKFSGRARKDTEDSVEDEAEVKDESTEEPEIEQEEKPEGKDADLESETADGDNGEETEKSEEEPEEQAEKTEDKSSDELIETVKSLMQLSFDKFGEEVVKALEKIDSRIDGLEKANIEREKREKEKELEPLSTAIYERLSAIGSKETEVSDEDELSKGPKETEQDKDAFAGANSFSEFLAKSLFNEE